MANERKTGANSDTSLPDQAAYHSQDTTRRLETLFELPGIDAPCVSPNRDEVAIIAETGEGRALYTQPVEGGTPTRWSDDSVRPFAPGRIRWNEAGDRLYVFSRADEADRNGIVECSRTGEAETIVETTDNVLLVAADEDRVLYLSDADGGFTPYRYDRERDVRDQLTTQTVWPGRLCFSRTRGAIAFSSAAGSDSNTRDAYVLDVAGGESRRLDIGTAETHSTAGDWFPDGKRLLVGENTANGERVGVYDCRDDTVSWMSDDSIVEEPAAVSPDATVAVSLRKRDAAIVPVVYDFEADTSRELDGLEGLTALADGRESGFVNDHSLLATHQSGSRRERLLRYDLRDGTIEEVRPADYGDLDPDGFVEPEYVRYESDDGLGIGALLYEPADWDGTEPGPAVVLIHGGPHVHAQRRFDPLVQELLNSGVAVLQPNYRGSTGRGQDFEERLEADGWGGMEQVDIRRGAEWLAGRESVDADRIGCYGRSFGGYSAYCQLTMHAEPWACGVGQAGITDLLADYEAAPPSTRSTYEEMFGAPDENEDRYRERSPLEHVEALDVPVKIVHGTDDRRCSVSQARQLRDALADRGWESGPDGEFEYAELDGLGHHATTIEQQCRVGELVVDFFERRL